MGVARKLAVTKQHLSGKLMHVGSANDLTPLVRDLGYIQWDPVSVVAPSHLISFWSRVENFRQPMLEDVLWKEKSVFEHWNPIATLGLTEDYPIYYSLMMDYPESLSGSWGNYMKSAREEIRSNAKLLQRIQDELKAGPKAISEFPKHRKTGRSGNGWSAESKVSRMIYHLHMSGKVMVVGHRGNQNVWGLSEHFLPDWANRAVLPQEEVERLTAIRALGALGTATLAEINFYFVRGRYRNLRKVISGMLSDGTARRVRIDEIKVKEERYMLESDFETLDAVTDSFEPRLSLISPFDNVISGRERTRRIFGFDYIHEQFLPKEKRTYGTYVIPILWGDSFAGRLDASLDRKNKLLKVNSVHSEGNAAEKLNIGNEIANELERLAEFVGAEEVAYTGVVPGPWRNSLH